ncbi:MAG TPA: VWA domain-containing protein [Pirellulales bacterium]
MTEAVCDEPRGASLSLPSWLLSILFHAALVVVLGLTIQAEPPGAAVEEPDRDVGVVLKRVDRAGETEYQGPDAGAQPSPAAQPSPRQMVGDQAPIDIASALPKATEIIGIGGLASEGPANVRQMTTGKTPTANFRAGMGRTKVYGIAGQGFKFVYCFDHSASMGGSGHTALQAAKSELLASLDQLGPTHQFQIIFYNDHPTIFDITGRAGRLVFATDQNKQQARHFVEGIKAGGGTDHQAALDMALNLNPDVIFFLTDADQPEMSPGQLARLRRRNRAALINAIEFGQGPPLGDENFLMRLARENGGSYVYIDITKALHEARPDNG